MTGEWLAVAAGGALGALLRASLLRWVLGWKVSGRSPELPFAPAFATLLANLTGCVLLGLWALGAIPWHVHFAPTWADFFVTTGFCGGLTTFSTLCADLVWLRRDHGGPIMLVYLTITLVLGAAALNALSIARL